MKVAFINKYQSICSSTKLFFMIIKILLIKPVYYGKLKLET